MGFGTAITRTTSTLTAATTSLGATIAGATTTTTAAAGAASGGALGATLGALRGAADGVRGGAEKGSRSPTAAALTAVALGVTGILDWPLLLTVGGTALVVNRLTSRPDIQTRNSTATTPAPSGAKSTIKTKAPRPRGAATNRPRTTPAQAEDT